jgi:tRNA(Ile)-lysidine synthase
VLLNLARGTAIRGFCGIPPVRGGVIRPLIECERVHVEAYLEENGFLHIDDSSNQSDDYARNRLRHFAIPALKSVNPAFLRAAERAAAALRADADYLDAETDCALDSIKTERGYAREMYTRLAEPIRMRVLLRLLGAEGVPADCERLSRLDRLIACGGAEQLGPELFLNAGKRYFGLSVRAKPIVPEFAAEVALPGPGESCEVEFLYGIVLKFVSVEYEHCKENIKSNLKLLTNALDCDRINGTVILRTRRPTDRLRPRGRGVTKTLRDLFRESDAEVSERAVIPVLADANGPLWAACCGADERAAPSGTSKRIVTIELIRGC